MKTRSLVMIILMFILAAFAQQREAEPVTLQAISENLYQVLGGRGANGGAYIGENGVLLIDTKMTRESQQQVFDEIGKHTDLPIRYLINTHSDGDHINGNVFFPELTIIIAHENCRADFFKPNRRGEPSDWTTPAKIGFVPSLTFRDKMTLYLGEKHIELWYFGVGHTTGDAVVYFPEEKTAFLGDQVFSGRPQLIHSYKGGNSFQHVQTVQRMLDTLDAEKFCTGHSDILSRQDLQNHITEMKSLQDKIKQMVGAQKSLDEIKAAFEENEGRLIESIYSELKSR
ncbi:MBL fold metallo-hydrolase [candidate division KSB1 bacterium]|nr:MBL fold metallo-hydrolase [candidate division KSB1 bacterium]